MPNDTPPADVYTMPPEVAFPLTVTSGLKAASMIVTAVDVLFCHCTATLDFTDAGFGENEKHVGGTGEHVDGADGVAIEQNVGMPV